MNLRRKKWQGRQMKRWYRKHYKICLTMKILAIIMLILVGIGTYSFFSKDIPTKEAVAKTAEKETKKAKEEQSKLKPKKSKVEKSKLKEIEKSKTESRQVEFEEKQTELKRYEKIEILIAEHTISASIEDSNRNNNLAIAAKTINEATGGKNGYILNPGEKFSCLETIGEPTEEKGYKQAGVIVDGKSSIGIAGGICQISSTIFSAIAKTVQAMDEEYLFAQRHSKKSSYIDPEKGDKEATITYSGNIDFWFISTLPNPIRIYVETRDGTVTVKIFEIKEEEIPNEEVE